jgi:hypothetical protein
MDDFFNEQGKYYDVSVVSFLFIQSEGQDAGPLLDQKKIVPSIIYLRNGIDFHIIQIISASLILVP